MYKIWKKYNQEEIKARIFAALHQNVNYSEQSILGVPASYLDSKVFYQESSFVQDAPYISTLIQNPNHIGCHTLGTSESFFKGTQEIEKEAIEVCAVDILKSERDSVDGYIASGGTEANLQAVWVYKNYFIQNFGAKPEEIAILCSADSHYCVDKAANVFSLPLIKTEVNDETRLVEPEDLARNLAEAKTNGVKYAIVFCNMMTTMFGSVDSPATYIEALKARGFQYKIHVDGAFGGFYFPFSNKENELTFLNPEISSFTLDAHKMAQAPYGTGIFLIRKNLIHYTHTQSASYVEGEDCTLIGSRSGANAVAVWMILMKNGPFGWQEKIFILQKRTDWISQQLTDLGIDFYRHPLSNIITIRSQCLSKLTAQKYGLVPDSHHQPQWYKIVVMDHVTIEKIIPFLAELKAEKVAVAQ